MAKIYADIAGFIIGSIGKISYYMRYSENIARRKNVGGKRSDSPDAVEQRVKFGMLNKLSSVMLTVIALGFVQRKRGLSAGNAFLQLNKDIFTVEGDIITVDYEHLLCANGPLVGPEVEVTYSEGSSTFIFEQTKMEEEVNCSADDKIYAVLLEFDQGFCRLIELRQRGENGVTSIPLPQRWKKEHMIVYAFAMSADQKKASKSMYLTVSEVA